MLVLILARVTVKQVVPLIKIFCLLCCGERKVPKQGSDGERLVKIMKTKDSENPFFKILSAVLQKNINTILQQSFFKKVVAKQNIKKFAIENVVAQMK